VLKKWWHNSEFSSGLTMFKLAMGSPEKSIWISKSHPTRLVALARSGADLRWWFPQNGWFLKFLMENLMNIL
jgi:hypothetical protein